MKVMLVQGTWSRDDDWWVDRPGTFAEAVRLAGHTLVNGRPFYWDTELGGIGFGNKDLWGWEAAGLHLWDRLDPPYCKSAGCRIIPSDLCIIAHSHGRQAVKFACHLGLAAAKVIFVSGPVRKDVDEATPNARARIGQLVCINGGWRDRWQVRGALFDGFRGIIRRDPQADIHETFKDADHSSFLNDPKQFDYVLRYI
jgi:hypothetical protein